MHVHEILVLIACAPKNAHDDVHFGLNLYENFVYAASEISVKSEDWSEPSLLDNAITIKLPCSGEYLFLLK